MNHRLFFSTLSFPELTALQVYQMLALRAAVFVVEQNCPYLDPDGKDQHARHLMGYADEELAAYARVLRLPENNVVSIGRVIVAPNFRRHGFGRALMQEAIAAAVRDFDTQVIHISAQCYLLSFYESLGFVSKGDSYLEDDIPHIEMELRLG